MNFPLPARSRAWSGRTWLRWGQVGLLFLAGVAGASEPIRRPGSAAPPAEAQAEKPAHSEPRPNSAVPPEVDRALRDRQDLLTTSNLLTSPVTDARQSRIEKAETQLEIARQQRARKESAFAKTNLVELVTGDTPTEIKRSAMLELALLAQDENDLIRAQQVFSQFLTKYPDDPSVPEVLLRQGLLYRQMGAYPSALAKLYAVMSKSLNIDAQQLDYYQHLVLQAKTEIADTYFAQGRFVDAADYFNRLLKLDEPSLNRVAIRAKLVRCLANTDRLPELINHAETVLRESPEGVEAPEIRYELAKAFRKLGRNEEAFTQVFVLLQRQEATAGANPTEWDFWRLRIGNDLANQLYSEGDYLGALQIYQRLIALNASPAWQLPVWYQVGLAYERLQQPAKAIEAFGEVAKAGKLLPKGGATQNLTTIVEMAAWRRQYLEWSDKTEAARKDLVAHAPKPKDGADAEAVPK